MSKFFDSAWHNFGRSPWLWAIVVLGLLSALRLLYLNFGPLDLAPDEAQYWDWSRQLQGGYATKPPGIAWLIALSTWLFGNTEIAVRLPAVLGLAGVSLVIFSILKTWRNATWAWLGLIAVQVTPLLTAGGLLMTTDVPSTLAWLLALLLLLRVNWTETDRHWRTLAAVGVIIGIGGLFKLSVGLFYPALGLYLLFNQERRVWLLRPQIYVSGLIAILCLTPFILWNMSNDWEAIKHVIWQAQGVSELNPLKHWGELLLSQLGLWGPISFILIGAYWYLQRAKIRGGDPTGELLWWFSAPIFVVFLLQGIDAKVQPNWPLLGVVTAFVGMLGWLAVRPRWVKILFFFGLGVNAIVSLLIVSPDLVRAAGIKGNIHKDVTGWEALGEHINQLLWRLPPDTQIITTRYQTTAQLAFYVNGQPRVHYINPGYRRMNQYEIWGVPEFKAGTPILYVNEGKALEPIITQHFIGCNRISQLAWVCLSR